MSDETQQPTPEPTQPQPSPDATVDNAEPISPIPVKNPKIEENPLPISPQEPIPDAPIPPVDSVPLEVPLEAPEASPSPEEVVPLNNDIPAPPSPEASDVAEAMSDKTAGQGNEPLDEQARRREENLKLANEKRQDRKRKKIDAILDLLAKQANVTNDEVEKLLHVSDATATRYLETLEKEGKIKQIGKTGRHTHYQCV